MQRGFGTVCLPALRCEVWEGFVFAAYDPDIAPLAPRLERLKAQLANYEIAALRAHVPLSMELNDWNWKHYADECYHCPMIHPELCQVSPPKSGDNYHSEGGWVGGTMDLREGMETMSLDGSSRGVMLRGLDAADNEFVIGLVGRELHPLSHLIQAMRKTRQTSEFIEKMGPFFVGHVAGRA